MFDWVAKILGSRRLSACLVALLCLLLIVGPITWIGVGMVDGITWLVTALDAGRLSLPPPVETVKQWPVIGTRVHEFWSFAAANTKAFLVNLAPALKPVGMKMLNIVQGLGVGILEFMIAIVVAGFMFNPGPQLVDALRAILRRILSDRGDELMQLAGATIRNVSQGVIGVALLQTALGGLGLVVADVPAAGFLTFVALLLAIIQIGPALVFLPTVIWYWMTHDTAAALIFTVYMIPVGLVDNVLRPLAVSRGLKTPVPIIVIGVFGGTLSYGLLGLFLGPIVLSVVWTLSRAWLHDDGGVDADSGVVQH